mgnify:CR=1 FL=1
MAFDDLTDHLNNLKLKFSEKQRKLRWLQDNDDQFATKSFVELKQIVEKHENSANQKKINLNFLQKNMIYEEELYIQRLKELKLLEYTFDKESESLKEIEKELAAKELAFKELSDQKLKLETSVITTIKLEILRSISITL